MLENVGKMLGKCWGKVGIMLGKNFSEKLSKTP
jgi:hypothetical protein